MSGSGLVSGGTSLGGVSADMWDWLERLGMATSSHGRTPEPVGSKPDEFTSDGRERLWMP